jgi:DNA polymerase-3 subunit gamma/tau
MLTKEAFNALLKTLEEPPPSVKFFLATTEPERIPATIISRCQRFDLARIRKEVMEEKLRDICKDMGREASREALRLIAHRAEGLRDAESLLDQILSYSSSPLSLETVSEHLGLTPSHYFFSLDEHFAEGKAAFAFQLASAIIEAGYDPILFLGGLAEHYRLLLLLKYDSSSIQSHHFDFLSETAQQSYLHSATLYTLEQCLYILGLLVEWLQNF